MKVCRFVVVCGDIHRGYLNKEEILRYMKTKISKILGVGLTIIMLASLMILAAPASASTLSWGAETVMNSTSTYKNTLASGLDIVDLAANGDVVYAATSVNATPLYKSTDGGVKWSGLENSTYFPPSTQGSVTAVAVAPDDPDVVAIIISDNQIEYSTNGGASWTDLNIPVAGMTCNAIDIAPGTTRYVAVGGSVGGAAALYTMKLAMAQSWTSRYGTGATATQTGIHAVKYSPNYSTDKAIAVVSGNATSATFQLFRYELGDYEWNRSIDYLADADSAWTGGLVLTPTTAIAGSLAAADIALPSTFLANDEGERVAFVAVAGTTSGGGVMRITDIVQKDFQTWSGGNPGAISSVAYNDDGTLFAGSYTSNTAYQYLSPMASTPKATRVNTLKQPGGASDVIIALSGDTVVAGTTGDESAIALSIDDGYAYNDVALIDTDEDVYDDFAINADGSKIYIATHNTDDGAGLYDTSVWLKTKILGVTRWLRVLNVKNSDNSTAGAAAYMVRLAPDDDTAVYLSSTGTQNMWVSKNSGMESWKSIPNSKVTDVQDFVVADADTVYALDSAAGQGVSKSTNAGASWGSTKEPIESVTPYSIALAPNGDIFYGGTGGRVAFSKDGGATFSRMVDFGNVVNAGRGAVVTFDDGYADNNIIYVGIGTAVKRKTATTSTAPASTRGATTYEITGIGQANGIVYVITGNATQNSSVWQSLRLETATTTADAEWTSDTAGTTAETYLGTPNSLKIAVESDGDIKLFTIDTTSPALESFTDKVSMVGTTLVSPADEATVGVNLGSGRAYDITFVIERYSDSDIDALQIQVATDSNFDARIVNGSLSSITTDTIAMVIGPYGATAVAEFLPGETYYWRVRTTTPLNSPWSETRSFTVESLKAPFAVSGPEVGASDVSVNPTLQWVEYEEAADYGYQVAISEDPSFAILEGASNVEGTFFVVTDTLDYSTTYYWRVRGVISEPYKVKRKDVVDTGPWVKGVFTTMAEPVEAAPPVVITEPAPAPPPEVITIEKPVLIPAAPQAIPDWMLISIIIIGAVLVIALIVLIVRTRRIA